MEGENASGHGGQEEREAQAAGGRALCPPYCPFMCFAGRFFKVIFFSLSLSHHPTLSGAEALHGKQHSSARGEEGEKGSKSQAGVEYDGF